MKRILSCLSLSLAFGMLPSARALDLPVGSGQFVGTMDSLTNYACPEWFRDAKFGIWAHWGPQSVPMEGDWYARKMYQPGSDDYRDHLARFGHPSTNGYKDIIPLWKAEKWQPERLMELYKQAGAKYFVSMGTHHDNFFLWHSQLHRWNAFNMGPHRDVVGEWQQAALKNGLHFGVSEHLGASFTWFQDSHKSDSTGPLAGVPYDGSNSNDWDLYHFPAEPGDTGWYSNNPRWQQEWFNEITELVDNYHPDLLYSDGAIPFGNEVGLSLVAHYYNDNAARHDGKAEAVYNCKQVSGGRWVQDYERGVNGGINPDPWQTDTSIGDWFYNKHWQYQPLKWTVTMLVDIVSKNGNLLLNVVQRPDGSLDPEVEGMLHQLAGWTAVNGEAIFGSRPWQLYGEGAVRAAGGAFKENFKYTAKDIRFTTKGDTLYAIALGWPDQNRLTIRALAATDDPDQNRIQRVELLGHDGALTFVQTTNGLSVELPAGSPDALTCALRITGAKLKPVILPAPSAVVTPDAQGHLNFNAEDAALHGQQLQVEERGGKSNIGFWDKADEWIAWDARGAKPGKYQITANIAAGAGDTELAVEAAGQTLTAKVAGTAGWDAFATTDVGGVDVGSTGAFTLKVRAKDAATWRAINLRSLSLVPVSP